MISLDKQLLYLNINNNDNTFIRTLKITTKSFSFYIKLITAILFIFNFNPKIKLFFVVLLIINAILSEFIIRKNINRIKKIINYQNTNHIIAIQRFLHLSLFLIIIFHFNIPKINKYDILYAIISFHIIIHIYIKLFKPEIVYMNYLPKKYALPLYTTILLFSYSIIYLYTNINF